MLIAFTGDLHVNNTAYGKLANGLPVKVYDNLKAIDFLIESCIEKKVQHLIIGGDLYDNQAPNSQIRRLVNERLQKLLSAGIKVTILTGNHDFCALHHSLEPLSGWRENLVVTDHCAYEKGDGYGLVFIPHTMAVERCEATFKKYITQLSSKIPAKDGEHEGRSIYMVGHFPVSGAMQNDVSVNFRRDDVSVKDLEDLDFKRIFLFDFHKRQSLSKNKEIWYVGSLERQSFNEKDQEKGFCVLDTETDEIEWVNYLARVMVEIRGDSFDDVMERIEGALLEDTILSVKVTGTPDQFAEFQQRYAELSKTLKKKGATSFTGLKKDLIETDSDVTPIDVSDGINIFNLCEKNIESWIKEGGDEEEAKLRLALLSEIKKSVSEQLKSLGIASSGAKSFRFKWIKLHNFCRYGETDNVLDFDELFENMTGDMAGIAMIAGSVDDNDEDGNGAGKSAAFEGIPYVLFERMPRLSVETGRNRPTTIEAIRTDNAGEYAANEMYVELCMEIDGHEWKIKRGRKLNKAQTSHTAILTVEKDGDDQGARLKRDPAQIIRELIAIDFEPFCNSIFFAQKDTSKLFGTSAKNRSDAILNVLGVLQDLDAALKVVREDMKKACKSNITRYEGKIELLEERTGSISEDAINKEIAEIDKKIEEEQASLKQLEEKVEEVRASAGKIQSKIEERKSEIKTSEVRVEAILQKRDQDTKLLKERQGTLKKQVEEAERREAAFLEQKEELRKEFNRKAGVVNDIDPKFLDESDERIKAAQAKFSENDVKIEEFEKQNADWLSKRAVASKDRNSLQRDVKNYRAVLESGAESSDVTCSQCGVVQSVDEVSKRIADKEEALKAVEKDYTEAQEKCSEIEDGLTKLRKANALKTAIAREAVCVVKKRTELEAAKKELETVKKNAKTLSERWKNEKGEDAAALRVTLAKIDGEIKETVAGSEIEEGKLNSRIGQCQIEIQKCETAMVQLAGEMGRYKCFAKDSQGNIQRLSADKATKGEKLKNLREELAQLKQSRKDLKCEHNQLTRIVYFEDLLGSSGITGIRNQIVNMYLPIFNKHMSDFISILTDGKMSVMIEPGSMAVKILGGTSSIYEMLSGGEKDEIRLAANLALGMLSLGSSRSLPDTLFLDEIFGSLAPARRDRVFDLLRHLRNYFRRIMVITHDPTLRERFSRIVMMMKIQGITKIHLLSKVGA